MRTLSKKAMRQKNLLYKLRRKGIRCDAKHREIYVGYGTDAADIIQIKRLRTEFNYHIQLEIQ